MLEVQLAYYFSPVRKGRVRMSMTVVQPREDTTQEMEGSLSFRHIHSCFGRAVVRPGGRARSLFQVQLLHLPNVVSSGLCESEGSRSGSRWVPLVDEGRCWKG